MYLLLLISHEVKNHLSVPTVTLVLRGGPDGGAMIVVL